MTYITTSQFTAIADNITKTLLDIEASYITSPANNAPTIATITNGQTAGSNSLVSRVGAWTVPSGTYAYVPNAVQSQAGAVVSFLTIAKNALYGMFAPTLVALDQDLGGLADFIFANSLQVHYEFALAFNYVASNAVFKGWANYTPGPIEPFHVFPEAVKTFSTITVTGAATGTIVAGSALDLSKYAPQEIWLQNPTGSPTTDTNSTITFNYTDASGAAQTGATVSLSGALAAGGFIDTAVAGSNATITAIASGTATDVLALVAKPLRSVAY